VTLEARVREADGEKAAGALVLLHGRGADENDLYPLLDFFDPDRRFAAATPRAPLALPPGGWHWYAFREVGYPDPETFDRVFPVAADWLDTFLADRGLDHGRLVLGGFSQGAVMTYALGLRSGRPRPAAMIALSGFMPTVEGFELDLSQPLPPFAIGHGTLDPVISVEFGRAARDRLVAAGADVTYRESPIPHAIDPSFARELPAWIKSNVDMLGPGPGMS
jgi:phospholipase/carboxylesterase